MLFPELKNKKFAYVNLNIEAQKWISDKKILQKDVSFIDPKFCQSMVDDVHKKYDVDFSYGGWMEDRSFLWHGSYLDKKNTYIHLGIDINVPTGTKVATDFDAEVVSIEDDYPEQGGWGPTVTLKHKESGAYVVYAHLDKKMNCKVGDILKKGDIFATVGIAPYNGNWFPHLHVQIIAKNYFNKLEKNNSWVKLDGYGSINDSHENLRRFPDPLQYISLI